MSTSSHSFICYSNADGRDFALRLAAALEGGAPPFGVWFDVYEKRRGRLRPGEDWDDQVAEGIRTCGNFLFLMTSDSIRSNSVCKREWWRALRYKKPVIPIWAEPDVEMPFRLEPREGIAGSFTDVVERLRLHLAWLPSPAGILQALRDRLLDGERALTRAEDAFEVARIQAELGELRREIETQSELRDDPDGTARRASERIAAGIREDRETTRGIADTRERRFINAPPAVAPGYFQDRHVETDLLFRFLADDARRIVWLVGRGGMGKTALACRVLKALEEGRLPDGRSVKPLDASTGHTGIVYLSAIGSRRIAWHVLYDDLCRLLAPQDATRLLADFKKPHTSVRQRMGALLDVFARGRVVVLLDNFEDVIDGRTLEPLDTELHEALSTILEHSTHAIKVVITTRIVPPTLALERPAAHARLELDAGLPSPYAETILRELDSDGTLGLKSAPEALLSEAREFTLGNPRALEALFASLSADRDTSLRELLSDCARPVPGNVVSAIVGEAFARLDIQAQEIMQALALYGRPVSSAAVDYLLQAHRPGLASAATLRRLVNMHFVRKEEGRYYLHPFDARHALDQIPKGEPADRAATSSVYTRFALLHGAANYFHEIRTPKECWANVADLAPLLAEFELRIAGEEYDSALAILSDMHPILMNDAHYLIARDMHRRLEKLLSLPSLIQWNLARLADAEMRLTEYLPAIVHHTLALDLSRTLADAASSHACLSGLAWCHGELGDTRQAIAYARQALGTAGQLGAATEVVDDMSVLGWYLAKEGDITEALRLTADAVTGARANSDASSLAYALANWSGVLIDAGRYGEAVAPAQECLATVDVVNLRNWTNGFLALAHLMSDNLTQARSAAELAVASDEPENNPNVQALLGIVAARQHDANTAIEAFETAVTKAEELLQFSPRNYSALDTMAVAFAGLAVCNRPSCVRDAIAAHGRARAINRDAGVIARLLRLYTALAPVDVQALLAPIRSAARGVTDGP